VKTVLVADDEDFLRLLIRETLRGYTVVEARSGDEALCRAREAAPDLIILDWMMPGCDGLEVLRALRADAATREVPVLMVTARVGAAEREALETAGASGILAKPFGTAQLRASVGAILDG
jgi:two-component system phosphate regulon response regulator PhoB